MSQIAVLIQDGEPLISLTGNSGGAVLPSAGNIFLIGSGGTTVTGDPLTSTLTINVAGSGMTWQTISANQTLAVDNGYICTGGGALSLALPAASNVGDEITITLDGSTSFRVTQGAGQSVRVAASVTTTGAGGSITTTAQGDTVTLVCSVANLRWNVISQQGNLTVV